MMDDEDLVTACRSRGGPEGAENKKHIMIFNNYPRVKEGSDSYYCLVYQLIRYVKSQ